MPQTPVAVESLSAFDAAEAAVFWAELDQPKRAAAHWATVLPLSWECRLDTSMRVYTAASHKHLLHSVFRGPPYLEFEWDMCWELCQFLSCMVSMFVCKG